MVQGDYWLLQLMSQFRDRVRGRAPLVLVLSGALLMVMGGWPVQCTAMPKELLLSSNSAATVRNASPTSPPTATATATNDEVIGNYYQPRSEFASVILAEEVTTIANEMKSEYEYEVTPSSREQDHHRPADDDGDNKIVVVSVRKKRRQPENSSMRILSRTDRSVSSINYRPHHRVQGNSALVRSSSRLSGGGGVGGIIGTNRTKSGSNHLERNERSANLSHITSKIQLFIKNRLLQILPDGTVNGTQDDASDYSE